jgi:hypothetical protein
MDLAAQCLTWMRSLPAGLPGPEGGGVADLLFWNVPTQDTAYYRGQSDTSVELCRDTGSGQNVSSARTGDYLWYDDVDFGTTSPTSVTTPEWPRPARPPEQSSTDSTASPDRSSLRSPPRTPEAGRRVPVKAPR